MKIISHRGNLEGSSDNENHPDQINEVLKMGIDCEIDLWCNKNNIFLGHDEPVYKIQDSFLQKSGLWIHAKNFNALEFLQKTKFNYFWHEEDAATITSHGVLWCYPGHYTPSGITVIRGDNTNIPDKCYGVCTDYPLLFKKALIN